MRSFYLCIAITSLVNVVCIYTVHTQLLVVGMLYTVQFTVYASFSLYLILYVLPSSTVQKTQYIPGYFLNKIQRFRYNDISQYCSACVTLYLYKYM